jgi:hypothetical protein
MFPRLKIKLKGRYFDTTEVMEAESQAVLNTLPEHDFQDAFKNGRNAGNDRLCGLVVRVLGYRSGGPGSIPSTTRKKSSGSGTGSTQPREYN